MQKYTQKNKVLKKTERFIAYSDNDWWNDDKIFAPGLVPIFIFKAAVKIEKTE